MDSKILREAALAYQAVYDENLRQELAEEQIWEQVENWVNSLLEEGYDLSDYTWEEMYEAYLNEAPMTAFQAAGGQAKLDQLNKGRSGRQFRFQARDIEKQGQDNLYKAGGGDAARAKGQQINMGRGGMKPALTRQDIINRGTVAAAKPKFGTTTPKGSSVTSTGVTGLSAADRAAYSAGGGNAAAQKGMGKSTADVIKQGKLNLSKMDQGKRAPAGAKPTSGPSSVNPKTGLSAGPAAKSAAAAKPTAAPVAKPTAPAAAKPTAPAAAAAAPKPAAAPAATPAPAAAAPKPAAAPAPKPSALAQRVAGYKAGGPAMGAREKALNQSFDLFDVVLGHLLDEGYADTEDAALAIMANMSEDWKQSIVEIMSPAMQKLTSNRFGGKISPASGGGQSSTSGAARPAQPQRPQPPGGLTPMQRLQSRPDMTIR